MIAPGVSVSVRRRESGSTVPVTRLAPGVCSAGAPPGCARRRQAMGLMPISQKLKWFGAFAHVGQLMMSVGSGMYVWALGEATACREVGVASDPELPNVQVPCC